MGIICNMHHYMLYIYIYTPVLSNVPYYVTTNQSIGNLYLTETYYSSWYLLTSQDVDAIPAGAVKCLLSGSAVDAKKQTQTSWLLAKVIFWTCQVPKWIYMGFDVDKKTVRDGLDFGLLHSWLLTKRKVRMLSFC